MTEMKDPTSAPGSTCWRLPSRTAIGAARHRAAHQILEDGRIFYDPFACALTGIDPDALRQQGQVPGEARMRNYVCTRARFAEDALAEAVGAGVTQGVILGAGLDGLAYRSPFGRRLSLFEIDLPGLMAWKRAQLARIGVATPPWLRQIGLDLECDPWLGTLSRAGFDPARPSAWLCLGVTPYLTPATLRRLLHGIGALPGGAELVFDYIPPDAMLPDECREEMRQHAANCAALGEPWTSRPTAGEVAALLRAAGFAQPSAHGPEEMAERYLRGPDGTTARPGMGDTGALVVRARHLGKIQGNVQAGAWPDAAICLDGARAA